MSRRRTYYHGTTAELRATIIRHGLKRAEDVYAGAPSCWVTPSRSLAQEYAIARVLSDLAAAGKLTPAGITKAPHGLLVEIELAASQVRGRHDAPGEFYTRGDVAPERVRGLQLIDVRPSLAALPPFILEAVTSRVQAQRRDGDRRNFAGRNDVDRVALLFDSAYGPSRGPVGLGSSVLATAMQASLHLDLLQGLARHTRRP